MTATVSNEPSAFAIFSGFARNVGDLAETEGHHPDVSFVRIAI
jgi:pterin-4a-carbinolamine dehydratase